MSDSTMKRLSSTPTLLGLFCLCFLGTAGAMLLLPGPRSVLPGLGLAGMAVTGVLGFKGLLLRLREAEAMLGDSDRYVEAVAELAQEVHVVIEPRTRRLLYVNPAVATFLGHPREAFTGGGLDFLISLVHPEDHLVFQAQLRQLAELPEPAAGSGAAEPVVEESIRIRDGQGADARFRCRMKVFVRYTGGDPAELLGVFQR